MELLYRASDPRSRIVDPGIDSGSMVPFSVVIPTWKNLEYLDLCLRGLERNSAVRHEIVVFFNEFNDDCARWLEGKKVLHLSSPENLGVCAAVNRAAELASTDQICYMNDDMYPLPGWDTALAAYLGTSDVLWLSGTAIERGRATPCFIGGQDYGSSPSNFQEERLLAEYTGLARPYNTVSTWPPTLISTKDWRAIGGLDEDYFPGFGSDPDLAMKMHRHGCRDFIGVGNSLVYHFSKSTTGRFRGPEGEDPSKLFRRKWGMSRSRFLRKVIHRDKKL